MSFISAYLLFYFYVVIFHSVISSYRWRVFRNNACFRSIVELTSIKLELNAPNPVFELLFTNVTCNEKIIIRRLINNIYNIILNIKSIHECKVQRCNMWVIFFYFSTVKCLPFILYERSNCQKEIIDPITFVDTFVGQLLLKEKKKSKICMNKFIQVLISNFFFFPFSLYVWILNLILQSAVERQLQRNHWNIYMYMSSK